MYACTLLHLLCDLSILVHSAQREFVMKQVYRFSFLILLSGFSMSMVADTGQKNQTPSTQAKPHEVIISTRSESSPDVTGGSSVLPGNYPPPTQ
jgi:hypothetical protein